MFYKGRHRRAQYRIGYTPVAGRFFYGDPSALYSTGYHKSSILFFYSNRTPINMYSLI